jgi:hypothetical protein
MEESPSTRTSTRGGASHLRAIGVAVKALFWKLVRLPSQAHPRLFGRFRNGVLRSSPPIAPPPISEGSHFELVKNGAIE